MVQTSGSSGVAVAAEDECTSNRARFITRCSPPLSQTDKTRPRNRRATLIYSSSSPPPLAASFFFFTRPGAPPPNGEVRAKSMCFWDSRRTMKDGTLTIWRSTRMWRCLIRTRAWWIDLAMSSFQIWVWRRRSSQASVSSSRMYSSCKQTRARGQRHFLCANYANTNSRCLGPAQYTRGPQLHA